MHVAPLAAAVDARRAARSCSRCTYNAPSSVDNEPYYTTTHLLMKITAPPRHDPCYHPPQAPADCLKSRAQAPKGGALSLKPLRDARRSESRTAKPSFGAEASFESKALSRRYSSSMMLSRVEPGDAQPMSSNRIERKTKRVVARGPSMRNAQIIPAHAASTCPHIK